MPSPRVQRQIDRLLDEAEQALAAHDWAKVQTLAREVLSLDPKNEDGAGFAASAARMLAGDLSLSPFPSREGEPGSASPSVGEGPVPSRAVRPQDLARPEPVKGPTSFAAGRYIVKRFLGEGGKKQVYLAHDNLLDRDVAFALIKTDGLDEAGRDRIKREAQAMGRLGAHPHIVSVFDLGTEPPQGEGGGEGTPFIVTELMAGGAVEGLIEHAPEHRPPLDRTLEIGIAVCRGLEFAHANGIVHRDLKPGNVWLTADGTAKLGDFGLAIALDRSRLTQAGMMVGTVAYMPPEQATGGDLSPRADLYSLGAMLYELVTGRPPFIGDESVAIISQHLNVAPVSPSWHTPDVPPGIEALILRLLEKDPAKRPASAAEVRAILEGILRQAQDERRQPASGRLGASLSLAGEGQGEGEPQATGGARALGDNPMYRRTFVGREQELRQLQGAYDAAASGQGSLVMAVGEPGIGKTSLCEQLATYATVRGGKALVGHCYEEGSLSLPYLPFVEAMRSYVLAREPDDLKADLGSAAPDVARIVSEVRDRLTVELRQAGDPEEDRWRLLQAVTGFLRNAAAVQPLVLVLEDLHDADRGTLDLLVHLSHNLAGARLLICGTYRDIEVDRSHPLSSALAELRRGQNFLRIPLRGLTAEEVQRMMAGVAQQEVPWPFAELVHRQTEGNPLFVQEMLRYLVEEGLVERREGALRRVGDETLAGRIPEGLRDVIGKRLSRLDDKTNQVLSVAAVIGREFRLDVLQRVAALAEEEVEQALEQAAGVAVVEQRQATGTVIFRFTHAFFRQTLYEEIFVPRRIRLHQQVARALVAAYGRRADEHAAELAEHFAQTTDREDLEQALHYSEVAAQRAMVVYAYSEAEGHLTQALNVQEVLDPDDKAKRCDLLLALGEAILPGEDPGRAEARAAQEAFALAEAIGDADRAARAAKLALEAMTRRAARPYTYRSESFVLWTQRADRSASDGSRERVYADVCQGLNALFTRSPSAAHPYFRRALDRAMAGEDEATLYMAAGWALRHLQALRDRTSLTELVKLLQGRPRRGARTVDLAICLYYMGLVLLERGQRQPAEQAWAELDELTARTRDATARILRTTPPMMLAYLDGRLDEVLALYEQSETLERELDIQSSQGAYYTPMRALIDQGQCERALALTGGATARPGLAARALCLAYLGQHAESRSIRDRFDGLESDEDESAVAVLSSLLAAAILGGDTETVAPLVRRLSEGEPGLLDGNGFSRGRLLAAGMAVLGRTNEARRGYEQAIDACASGGFRPDLALSHLELAELLLEHFPIERAEALEHLDFAIAELREMKMQPALERALRHKEVLKA